MPYPYHINAFPDQPHSDGLVSEIPPAWLAINLKNPFGLDDDVNESQLIEDLKGVTAEIEPFNLQLGPLQEPGPDPVLDRTINIVEIKPLIELHFRILEAIHHYTNTEPADLKKDVVWTPQITEHPNQPSRLRQYANTTQPVSDIWLIHRPDPSSVTRVIARFSLRY